jgi:hypothetical protein
MKEMSAEIVSVADFTHSFDEERYYPNVSAKLYTDTVTSYVVRRRGGALGSFFRIFFFFFLN